MNINELITLLNKYENKKLPITIAGNNSFNVDITDVAIIENGKALLLYENSYNTKSGKCLLAPVKSINDMLVILNSIEDKNIKIKGRGTNGVLVSPTNCNICYIDNYAMLNLYDKSQTITIIKAKQDAEEFIRDLHID